MITEYLLKKSALDRIMMAMRVKLKKSTLMSITITLFLSFTLTNATFVFSNFSAGEIDLFTQKEPYGGKGPNIPSDAFAPGEVVILYASIKYNGSPMQSLLVTFYVQCPDNSSFSFVAATNGSGIASVNFTIPQKCPPQDGEVFGEWFALANVFIADRILQDTLTFKVDYIVKLISVRTIDENLDNRSYFGKGGDVGLEIALKNTAMVEKSATLAVVIHDELNVPVGFLEITPFEVQPNEKLIFLYCKLEIPKYAVVGKATIFVSALTTPSEESGVPYCPSISTEFFITPHEPLKLNFHDVSIVKVALSATSVMKGESVYINITVRNEGTVAESFNVSAYYDNTPIETSDISALTPYSTTSLNFKLDTSTVDPGKYTIKCVIPFIFNEADLTDNVFIAGVIEIKQLPTLVRYLVTFTNEGLSADAGETIVTVNDTRLKFSNLPYSIWVDEGSKIIYSYEGIVSSTIPNKRFRLQSIMGPSSPVTVMSNITIVGNYIAQYMITFDITGIDSSALGNIVTFNGISKNYQNLPYSFWADGGTVISYSYNSLVLSIAPGKRFSLTNVIGPTSPLVVVQPTIIAGNYKVQYFLTIQTDPAGIATISGEGWYDALQNVTLSAVDVAGYVFERWDVDGVYFGVGDKAVTIFMDRPHVATAHYSPRVSVWYIPEWFYWLLFLLLLAIIVLIVFWLYRRRKQRRAKEAFQRGWTAWYYCYDLKKGNRRI
jgi:hypothetical protein